MITETNEHWIDENNNSWNKQKYTKEQSQELSDTLTNCSGCSDCSDCSDCSNCYNCYHCSRCYRCSGCYNCSSCSDCSDCYDCYRCSDCSDGSNCHNCYHCSDCYNCHNCYRCSDFKSTPYSIEFINIGSRNDTISINWLCDRTEVVCGCYKGSLLDFEKTVIKTHGNNKHAKRYLDLINKVWLMMGV